MYLQKLLFCLLSYIILSALAKEYAPELIDATEAILQKEIDRFEKYKKQFEDGHENVSVVFTYVFKGENGNHLKSDTMELRSLSAKNLAGYNQPDKYDDAKAKDILQRGVVHNVSIVASRQSYDADGVLKNKIVLTDQTMIYLEDGNTNIQFSDDSEPGENEEDDSIDEYMGILKEFELPITVEKILYEESGTVAHTEKKSYQPEKVRIETVSDMPVDMQMKVAEALKRSCNLKDQGTQRIKLLVRYLGIQFPEYVFEAAIGDGLHFVPCDISIKVVYDGLTYYVWGKSAKTDEDSDSE